MVFFVLTVLLQRLGGGIS